MDLEKLVKSSLVFLDLDVSDRASLIDELARLVQAEESYLDLGALKRGLLEREELGGTMVGGGIILPHARVAPKGKETLAFARLKKPLALDTPDGKPIWMAALSVTDPKTPDRHLQILSHLAKVLHKTECIDALRDALEPGDFVRVFVPKFQEKSKNFHLLLAVLPDDENVHDYLNLLSGIGVMGATSVTARGMGEILSSGPSLFAGFRELFGAIGSSRLVISAIDETLLVPALDEFRRLKKRNGIDGVAFHMPLGGVVGMERQDA